MESPIQPTNHDSESLGNKVRSAVIWRSGSQIVAQLVQWAATFMVIRILAPADYGLFAMTQVVVLLLNMLNGFGLASGLIQQKEITQLQIRQLFGMLILVNVVLAAIQLILAPLASAYYRQPMIGQMLYVQALIYLTTPFIALPYALLSRTMEFRKQARINITASIASAGSALGGALLGWGVWTLVFAPIVMFAVKAIGMSITVRWLVWPSFNFRGAGHLARYGALMAISQLFWFVESQADVFIAGRSFDPHLLGIYTTSLFLSQIFVSKVMPPLNEVAFSAYARIQHDEGAVARAFAGSVRIIMVAALPFYCGLAVTAEPLVLTLLGPKWAEAIPIVRLLCFAMPMRTLITLIAPACDARGRPGMSVQNGATGAIILVFSYLVGVQYGVIGLAVSWLVAYPFYLGICLHRSLPIIGVSAATVFDSILPSALAATGMAICVLLIDQVLPLLAPPLRLGILVAAGGAIYSGWLALFSRSVIDELLMIAGRGKLKSA